MLNPFPELLTYSLMGPFILRVVLGLIFLDLGILKFRSEKARWIASFQSLHLNPADILVSVYATLEIVGALMLAFGLYTQIAALAFIIFTALEFYIEYKDASILKRNIVFYLLLLAISVSILLTGAGAFAFDIPL